MLSKLVFLRFGSIENNCRQFLLPMKSITRKKKHGSIKVTGSTLTLLASQS